MPPGSVYLLDIPAAGAWSTASPAPAVPANLTATAGNGGVTLRWSSVDGAGSYNVQRSTTPGGPYTSVAQPTGAGYTDSGLANGTTYYYLVAAVNTGGQSANSSEVSATPNVEDIAFTATAPSIDGSSGGVWSSVTPKPLAHDFNTYTPDTASFQALWDNSNVYILVSVQDSTLTNGAAYPFSGDSVEVYFSGTDSKASSYGPTDFQYAFPYGGAAPTESKHNAISGVQFGQQTVSGGYRMTIAIPWTTLGTTPTANTQYGFDVMINDATSSNHRIGKLAWWGTVDQSWEYPYLFGPAVLEPQQ